MYASSGNRLPFLALSQYSDRMNDFPPVSQALSKQNIPHRVFRHEGQVTSLEQAAQERGQAPAQVVRSIVFRLTEGKFIMVLVAGPSQISWLALRTYLGQSRLTMATPEEVLMVTGYPIGAVAPIGIKQPLRVLIDESVFQQTEISMGSGERNVGIILQSADLRRALGEVEVGIFSGDSQKTAHSPGAPKLHR